MSSGSPSIQSWKPGAAKRLLSCMARREAVLGGIERLRASRTPILLTGGFWICWIRPRGRGPDPFRQASKRMRGDQDVLPGLWIGSASTPMSPSRLVTVVLTRSWSSSSSSIISAWAERRRT